LYSLGVHANDEAVSTEVFCSVMDPILQRVCEFFVDGMAYSIPAPPPDSEIPGVRTNFVAIRHLKIALTFDPFLDWDADGLPDWWERYYGLDPWGGMWSGKPAGRL